MAPADGVDTLLFDVLGTVVDEAGSMHAELTAALDQVGAAGRADDLAEAWPQQFAALVSSIIEGAPWQSTDELNAEALAYVLRDGPQLPKTTVRHLALVRHRLKPWPDAQAALRRLAERFTIKALRNRRTRSTYQHPISPPSPRTYSPTPDTARTGRVIADGCSGSCRTCWSAARSRVAVALGSPVPGLRL